MKLRIWLLIAPLALALLAPAGAGALTGGVAAGVPEIGQGEEIASPSASPGRISLSPPIAAVQPDQSQAFAILRTPAEGLPPAVKAILELPQPPGESLWGLNFGLAQLAQGSATAGRSLWVVPGRGYLELFEVPGPYPRTISGAPATTTDAVRGGIAFGRGSMGSPKPGDHEPDDEDHWVGLVPDRVAAVRLGRHTVAHVENNVYLAEGRFTDLYEHFRFVDRDSGLAHAAR